MPDPIRHRDRLPAVLLAQQWDSLQTTLNLQPNPSVDVAKACFAVRFGSSQNERERKLSAGKEK